MAVSFSTIPSKVYTPLFYAEVDNSAANTTTDNMQALIIGPMLASGKATAKELTVVNSAEQAAELFGSGSILHRMVAAYRNQDSMGTLYALPLEDPVSGVAQTRTITVTGTATEAGVISLYIGYELVQVAVSADDVPTIIGPAIQAAINANTSLPVTATSVDGVVTVTAKHKGLVGADIPLNLNLLGAANGETLPGGIALAFADGATGAGVPDLAGAFAALKEEPFEFIAIPYAEATSWNASKTAMTNRWAYNVQLYGHVYSIRRGEQADLLDIGETQNDPHLTVFAASVTDPNFACDRLGAIFGQIAQSVKADPARPFQTLTLNGITAPRVSDRFDRAVRESLLAAGVATCVDTSSDTQIERAVTTYIQNKYGSTDNSYQDAVTLHTLGYIIRYLRTQITSKYGRHKLADDGTSFGEGQAIVTPSIIRSELIAAYTDLMTLGLVENIDAFKSYLVVERNKIDPNRVDVLFPPDLINQLRVLALLAQFRLQY
nr:MAG TPA: tail component [Bacteriophage sp.]